MISPIMFLNSILCLQTDIGVPDTPAVEGMSWLVPLANLLDWLLGIINGIVPSYGASIIVLAVLFRLVLLPVSVSSARYQRTSAQKREDLAPRLREIRKASADDPKREYSETMALYREHGLNPAAQLKGCLPLLIQLPLLFALYQLLSTSPELTGREFLWIGDLSRPDALFELGMSVPYLGSSFNLLPVVMFIAQMDIARSMAASKKSNKGKGSNLTAYLLPLVMLVLFYPFPSGCMLYWTVSNLGQAIEHRVF